MGNLTRKAQRVKRHLRIRQKISGTEAIPRMSVYVTGRHMYVQFIDDTKGHTIVAASTLEPSVRKQNIRANCQGAEVLGKIAGERALSAGIKNVIFDRGGFTYHGRIHKIAESSRKEGLVF